MSRKRYRWNAVQYEQHSTGQFEWARELMEKLHLRGDETLLDIGCGDGKVTVAIADRLPRGQVIGIDNSAEMIALAIRRHGRSVDRRLTFKILDVRDLDDQNRYDVIFSNAVLHWIKRHLPVLQRVCRALKPGGRLLFQMGGRGNAREVVAVLNDLIQSRWSAHFTDFTFPYGFYGISEYTDWLARAGLVPARVECFPKDMQHRGRDDLGGWIRSTWLPYVERIPAQSREAFVDDVLDAYLRRYPLDENGIAHVEMVRLEVEAFRPEG